MGHRPPHYAYQLGACDMRPMAGARSTAGEYPALALRPTQVDARCKIGIASRRTFGHAVSNPRIRACSPTSSDLAPPFGGPQCNNRSGVPKRLKKSLKKDIRAVRRSHGFGVVPRQQLFDVGLFVPASNGCQDTGQIAMGFNPVEFTGLD